MNKLLLTGIVLFSFASIYGQTLKFEDPNKIFTKEEKKDHDLVITFSMEDATKDVSVKIEVDDKNSSATLDKDYSFTAPVDIKLTTKNKYSEKITVSIKADNFSEGQEELKLKFSFKNDKNEDKSNDYLVLIGDLNDGSAGEPVYTDAEKRRSNRVSYDIFTGGNFDFFDNLQVNNVGGELVINANSIVGKDDRFGFYTGLFNFKYLTYDSSNLAVRSENVRIDTGVYIPGTTKYIQNRYVDHPRISTSQWGYYFNPTFRLNKTYSDFFNIYVAARIEVLRTSIKTQFITDTISANDTSNNVLNNPVFVSGKGFLLQNYTSMATNGYFGFSLPMWLNAKDKVKFYFEPGFGVATYTRIAYAYDPKTNSRNRTTESITPGYYLFRFRAIDQFTKLQITIGGEIRGLLPSYSPAINLYLGLRVDLAKWFGGKS